jgi:hypothetical protein
MLAFSFFNNMEWTSVPMMLSKDAVFFGTEIRIREFELLFLRHIEAFPRTASIEAMGAALIQSDFPGDDVRAFVKDVCGWGNYSGIAGRVLKDNPIDTICDTFRAAALDLQVDPTHCAGALAKVNRIAGLGQPAFASKHLRFLRPEFCPVFDSLLYEALPYSYDTNGYGRFAVDCAILAARLQKSEVVNPRRRPKGVWFAADVEAAIYAYIAL